MTPEVKIFQNVFQDSSTGHRFVAKFGENRPLRSGRKVVWITTQKTIQYRLSADNEWMNEWPTVRGMWAPLGEDGGEGHRHWSPSPEGDCLQDPTHEDVKWPWWIQLMMAWQGVTCGGAICGRFRDVQTHGISDSRVTLQGRPGSSCQLAMILVSLHLGSNVVDD